MSVKTFEKNRKNISENILKLKLEQNEGRLGVCDHEITRIMQFAETSF